MSDAIFAGITKALETDGEKMVKSAKAVFCFKIKDTGAAWLVNLKDGKGSVTKAEGKADCTITIADADLVAMAQGKLNGMQAFMQGKMKIAGNMGLAQKLQAIFSSLKK
eukprot:g11613.t1